MNPRFALALLVACTAATAHAQDVFVNGTYMSAEQYRQYQQERAWRAQDERKRQEALAIAMADQAREQAALQSSKSQAQAVVARNNAEVLAARQNEAARAEAARLGMVRSAYEADRAAAAQAAAAARSGDIADVEREARRHARAAALAEVKAGRITRAEALRRMGYSNEHREAIVDGFKAGMYDKPKAFALLAEDDRRNAATPTPTATATTTATGKSPVPAAPAK